VPWVRWWDRRANAYDALLDAQPALRAGAARVARAALAWRRGAADPSRPLVAVDLAAGAGDCAWALRDLLGRGGARLELVEPGHAMAALARSRAAGRARGAAATVWQIPVERCAERLPARLLGAVDVATCSAALPCINEHDVFEAAAALLKPGGALAFDLPAESYDGAPGGAADAAWAPAVEAALARAGLAPPPAAAGGVARVRSAPPPRPPCSASSLAAAAAAAGLRLAACDLVADDVGADLFVARAAMSASWLRESFAPLDRAARRKARAAVLLDAAAVAAARRGAAPRAPRAAARGRRRPRP